MENIRIQHNFKDIFESSHAVKLGTCLCQAITTQCSKNPNTVKSVGVFYFKNMIQKAIHRHCFSDPEVFSSMSSLQQLKEMGKRICPALKEYSTARCLNRIALRRLVRCSVKNVPVSIWVTALVQRNSIS